LFAMRTGTWKLIVAPRPELYNVKSDPGETQNLISQFPADADQLQKRLLEVAGEQGRHETVAPSPVDRKTREALESLGYVSGGTRPIQLGTKAPDAKDRVEVLGVLTRVEDMLNTKDYARAANTMDRGLRLDPTNPRGHLYLAASYEQMGQYRRAIQVFKHALDLKVESDKIYSRLGVDYLHLQEMDKAVDAMTQANRMNPADLNNLLNLGMAHLQLGHVGEAEKAFRAITAQDDRFASAHDGLGLVATQRGDTEAARSEFEKAIEVNPDELKALLDLGILYRQTGNRQQALHYLQLFVSKVPRGQFKDQLPAVREAIQEMTSVNTRPAK
jgi:tetratricopeptide (TPR) repeat protein